MGITKCKHQLILWDSSFRHKEIIRVFSKPRITKKMTATSLSDPGGRGGGAPGARPLTAYVFMPKMLIVLKKFSLAINFKQSFNRNMAKTRKIMTFTSTINTFNAFLPPPPLTKSTPPPLRSNPESATVPYSIFGG